MTPVHFILSEVATGQERSDYVLSSKTSRPSNDWRPRRRELEGSLPLG